MIERKVSESVTGQWFGSQGDINADKIQPLYDVASMEAYVEGGYKPIPESQVHANHFEFNRNTINEILPTEMLFSFFNHRQMYIDCHREEWSKPRNLISRIAQDIKAVTLYHMGRGSRAVPMPEKVESGPCIIIGSGCSLDDAIPHLKGWKGGIICSSSQASTLMYHGIVPTHILTFDVRTLDAEFDAKRWDYKRTKLVTWMGIHPSVNGGWQGEKYFYRVMDPSVMFYMYALPAGYNWIPTQLQPFAHSLAMQAAVANWLGYSPLILVGADFAYRKDKTRFDAWFYRKPPGEKRKRWIQYKAGPVEDCKQSQMLIHSAGGQVTNYTFLHYRKTQIAEQWIDGSNVFDCSEGVLNGLLPKVPIEDVVDSQGRCLKDRMVKPQVIRDRLEPWLASEQTYFVPMLGGHKLIMANDELHLMQSLVAMKDYDDNLDIAFEHRRLWGLHEEGEKLRSEGYYGQASYRE
uniref:6-hydroxymethylpterin diphosphokinase MptE-like domain-containing protein n=1 Tax=viral metagenome TaxID=1070528 RepID=A0A6M3IGH3_9ZZZZ